MLVDRSTTCPSLEVSMAKRLRLKKVTLRDVDDQALKHIAGGDDSVFSCPSECT
jgi:hypothetical protein